MKTFKSILILGFASLLLFGFTSNELPNKLGPSDHGNKSESTLS